MNRIYLDYASATPVLQTARQAMNDALSIYGNPGAIHSDGVEAKRILDGARENIAKTLACKAREIVFTSGGTEANNLAIVGFARTCKNIEETHWIVSSIEHPSVLDCFGEVERLGGAVTFVDPDTRGVITPEVVLAALRPDTVFVSIGWANSEIGTIQPIADIVRAVRQHTVAASTPELKIRAQPLQEYAAGQRRVIIHSDAGQAPLYLPTTIHTLGVDLLTLDSGKMYGPRGVGALYVSNNAALAPIMFGGKQERGLRPGTENIALAAGFAAAYGEIAQGRADEAKRIRALRDEFSRSLLQHIPHIVLNTNLIHSLPHILNISLPDIKSEYITLQLDHAGVSISTKSACREGEASRSHVVEALGGETWRASNTVRFSLGRDTEGPDLARVIELLRQYV